MNTSIPRRHLAILALASTVFLSASALAQDAFTPDGLIRELATETLNKVRTDRAIQAGNMEKIKELVEARLMPHFNFKRLTAYSMGRHWRDTTDEQKKKLEAEFRSLLIRTYAGALSQVKDHQLAMKPLRAGMFDTDVVIQTQIRGRGDPIQMDYRMEKNDGEWKVYDMNIMGIWLGDQYRSSFAMEISRAGIDGLIRRLEQQNGKRS